MRHVFQVFPQGRMAVILVAAFTGLLLPSASMAHGEEINVNGGKRGPVTLAAAQQRALGLTVAPAGPRDVAEILTLSGEVKPVAGRQGEANSRIPGRITAVYATLGQSVRADQRLARVQSRLVGDPPPSVDIVAPMAGIIERADARIGQSVEPETPLFGLRDSREVRVVARVYEEDLGKIQVGQAATLRFISYPGRVFDGKLVLVGPTLDPSTRTVDVWVDVTDPAGLMKPNLFASVGVVLRRDPVALAVPDAAIVRANGEAFVFVSRGGKFVRVEITPGVRDGAFTEVLDGLVPGDKVVVQGSRQVYTAWLTGTTAAPHKDG